MTVLHLVVVVVVVVLVVVVVAVVVAVAVAVAVVIVVAVGILLSQDLGSQFFSPVRSSIWNDSAVGFWHVNLCHSWYKHSLTAG